MRDELRKKVEHQQELLQRALAESEAKGHPADRIQGLSTQLTAAADLVKGGWDTMADVTAGQLSRWLEDTRYLVSEAPTGFHKPSPPAPVDPVVEEIERSENPNE